MKIITRALVAAVVLAGSTFAMADEALLEALKANMDKAILDVPAAELSMNVDAEGVATISGTVDSTDKEKILEIANNTAGITSVVDLMQSK